MNKMNKLTIEPKYWAIVILAAIATGAGAVYYARQPAPDLGPIVVHHQARTASSTAEDLKDWKTYSNNEYSFELKYPNDWPSDYLLQKFGEGTWHFQNTSSPSIHGIGIPGVGSMWVDIAKGVCHDPSDDFVLDYKPDIAEKTICKDGFQIILGLWQADTDFSKHKMLLDQILSTFKFLPPTESECVASGGRWGKFGLSTTTYCDLPPWDQ